MWGGDGLSAVPRVGEHSAGHGHGHEQCVLIRDDTLRASLWPGSGRAVSHARASFIPRQPWGHLPMPPSGRGGSQDGLPGLRFQSRSFQSLLLGPGSVLDASEAGQPHRAWRVARGIPGALPGQAAGLEDRRGVGRRGLGTGLCCSSGLRLGLWIEPAATVVSCPADATSSSEPQVPSGPLSPVWTLLSLPLCRWVQALGLLSGPQLVLVPWPDSRKPQRPCSLLSPFCLQKL